MKKNTVLSNLALIAITALGPEHWIVSMLFAALVIFAWKYGGLRRTP